MYGNGVTTMVTWNDVINDEAVKIYIGNVINRVDHAQSGAVMAFRILDRLGMDPEGISTVITAIGNHVRYTRVRNQEPSTFDIHDRVNFSVKQSEVQVVNGSHIELNLQIDTSVCAVMDYFEIFMGRMILCRKAAEKLALNFRLVINGQRIL